MFEFLLILILWGIVAQMWQKPTQQQYHPGDVHHHHYYGLDDHEPDPGEEEDLDEEEYKEELPSNVTEFSKYRRA